VNPRGPKPTSLAGRTLAFFKANPDEELTYADIAAKFDVSLRCAYSRMTEAQQRGYGIEVVTIVRLKREAK
jgi:hypothetical protein